MYNSVVVESVEDEEELTVGFDGGEDLVFEADLLDVLNVRVPEEEELVGEHEVWLLSSFLAVHCDSVVVAHSLWV